MGGHEEGPVWYGGTRVFSIGHRMVHQRERLLGMTPEERRWRAQFLKDQILAADEPRFSPELYKETNNIFRRLYRMPMNIFQNACTPFMGEKMAFTLRKGIVYGICFLGGAWSLTYWFKYHLQDWERTSGWHFTASRRRLLPGEKNYPVLRDKTPQEYYDLGFSKSVLYPSKS